MIYYSSSVVNVFSYDPNQFVTGHLLFTARASFRISRERLGWREIVGGALQVSGKLIAVAERESVLPRLVDNKAAV